MQQAQKKLTAEQRRAKHAWQKASEGVTENSKYINLAKGLPALIMNSGLMQVMAFLEEKGKKQSEKYYALLAMHLREWLHEQMGTPTKFEEFIQHLAAMEDARRFQAITTEAMAWLKWLRQLAPAVSPGSEQ